MDRSKDHVSTIVYSHLRLIYLFGTGSIRKNHRVTSYVTKGLKMENSWIRLLG